MKFTGKSEIMKILRWKDGKNNGLYEVLWIFC